MSTYCKHGNGHLGFIHHMRGVASQEGLRSMQLVNNRPWSRQRSLHSRNYGTCTPLHPTSPCIQPTVIPK
jgi:hypothetical protein